MKMDNWMPTASGGRFYLDPIDVKQVKILDIALGLARQPRFNGQWRYGIDHCSVAEHCVWASYLVPQHLALAALVHDAHEALIGDMTAPLKAIMPEYCAFEDRFEAELALHFGWDIGAMKDPLVKRADLQMLSLERTDVIASLRHPFACLKGVPEAPAGLIKRGNWAPGYASMAWLDRYKQLRGTRG